MRTPTGFLGSPGALHWAVAAVAALMMAPAGAQHLYVSGSGGTFPYGRVLRYDATTGAFLDEFCALRHPGGIAFGADGHVYIASLDSDTVEKHDGETGELLSIFVTPGSGGLREPRQVAFGPDGNLYVASYWGKNRGVLRYDGVTGAFIDHFFDTLGVEAIDFEFGPDGRTYVTTQDCCILVFETATGAMIPRPTIVVDSPAGIAIGPDGDLYVASVFGHEVLRYDGASYAFKGAFVDDPELRWPSLIEFGPGGDLYVVEGGVGSVGVRRYDGATGAPQGVFAGVPPGILPSFIAFRDDRCYADCDRSGELEFFDFLCFQNLFAAGDPEADCDGSGGLDFFEFLCFQDAFAAGCS